MHQAPARLPVARLALALLVASSCAPQRPPASTTAAVADKGKLPDGMWPSHGPVETMRLPDIGRPFTECPRLAPWGCRVLTTGAAPPPGLEPASACGCVPACPQALYLMTTTDGSTWPDGSPRARFACVNALPP